MGGEKKKHKYSDSEDEASSHKRNSKSNKNKNKHSDDDEDKNKKKNKKKDNKGDSSSSEERKHKSSISKKKTADKKVSKSKKKDNEEKKEEKKEKKRESKNKEVENQSERKPDANLEQVEIQKTSLASQALDQSEIEQKRMNSEKMWSKWADCIKIDLTKQLTLEELNLLNSKSNLISEEIYKLCKHHCMKIENNKLKIKLESQKNFNMTITSQNLISDLRKLLDNYSIIPVDLAEDAVYFDEEMLNNIIDEVLDNSKAIIQAEEHPNKGDSISWVLENKQNKELVTFTGKTSEVKACIRLINSFNKLIKTNHFDGILPGDFTLNEEKEHSCIIEKNCYICAWSDKEQNKTYLNYIKGKIQDKECMEAVEKINRFINNSEGVKTK